MKSCSVLVQEKQQIKMKGRVKMAFKVVCDITADVLRLHWRHVHTTVRLRHTLMLATH